MWSASIISMYGVFTCCMAVFMAAAFPCPSWVMTLAPFSRAISTVLSVECPSTTSMLLNPHCFISSITVPIASSSFRVGITIVICSGLGCSLDAFVLFDMCHMFFVFLCFHFESIYVN